MQGDGILFCIDYKYEGKFFKNKKNGYGILSYKNGDFY